MTREEAYLSVVDLISAATRAIKHIKSGASDPSVCRCLSLSLTKLEEAEMWLCKADVYEEDPV